MIEILILAVWLALLVGFLGGLAWFAYHRCAVVVLTRRFLAELAAVAVVFTLILWGLPMAGLAIGVCP